MDEMTDLQFKAIIKSIIQIIKDNEDKKAMIEKNRSLSHKGLRLPTHIKDMAVLAAAVSMMHIL